MSERLTVSSLQRARVALLHLFRVVVLSVAVFAVAIDPPGPTFSVDEFALVGALFMISLLDIGLAHGDTADVDTALLVAGVYLYGAPALLVMCTVVRLAVHLLARRGYGLGELMDSLVKRYAAILLSIPVLALLASISLFPPADRYVDVLLLGLVFGVVQLIAGQIGRARERHDSIFRLLVGNLILQGPLLASGVSVAILIVLIIDDMGPWGIALTLVLLLAMRQSFALLLDIRASYQATIEALIGAMEAQRTESRGSGDRVAAFTRRVAAELGWFGSRVERVGYAALLYYFGLPLKKQIETDQDSTRNPLSDVEFLRPTGPILEPLEGDLSPTAKRRDIRSAYVVARSVDEFAPGRCTDRLRELEEHVGDAWVRQVGRAVARAREKM